MRDRRRAPVSRHFTQLVSDASGWPMAIARFVPGGRTVVTLSAGLLEFPWRRFILFDAGAAVTRALYASLLGFFGGRDGRMTEGWLAEDILGLLLQPQLISLALRRGRPTPQ
jgi:membrane protein DedA with SNARE-associated domain